MKRADLQLGTDYLYRPSTYSTSRRCRLVNLERYAGRNTWSRLSGPGYVQSPTGTRALVDIWYDEDEAPIREAVPLTRIIGPWVECKAAEDAERKAKRAKELTEREAYDARRAQVGALLKRINHDDTRGVDYNDRDRTVTMSVALLQHLVEGYEE